jgi:K+-sensing histidine kinase KdpD
MDGSSTMSPALTKELDCLYSINQVVNKTEDWKAALDEIVKYIRKIFIFDNLVLYLPDSNARLLEAAYARAVGRGRSSGADLSWGEAAANHVLSTREIYSQQPPVSIGEKSDQNRLEQPYVLGIPLKFQEQILGILVFIRFGGPAYDQNNTRLAVFIGEEIAHLLERKHLKRMFSILQEEHQQTQLQENFITTISHELLTPLGFIKGYATTLLRSDTSWDENTRREFLTIIDQETDRLQELIDNILDSTRLQSGNLPMEFQPVRLDVLVRDVIMKARLNHKDLQVIFKPEISTTLVQGDPRRLAQVFDNLLSNAVKYAPGSAITITISKEKEKAMIVFSDNGPGIPPQYLSRLFERFFRNPEQAINVHGTGLGLYICRQIITAHQGSISIDSVLGEGTNVRIQLPCDQQSKPSKKASIDEGNGAIQ